MSKEITLTESRQKKIRNMLPAGALGLSVLLHGIVLLIVGGAVLVEGVIPKQAFQDVGTVAEAEDTLVVPETPPEDQMDKSVLEQVQDPSQATTFSSDAPSTAADIIIADSPNGSMSLLPVMSSAISPMGTSLGTTTGSQASGRGTGPTGRKIVNLFGNTLESSKMGVILDVSGSVHGLLLPVMKEIDKNYGNAPTVLVFGCGMIKDSADKKNKVSVSLLRDIPDFSTSGAANGNTTLGQIASAVKKFSDLGSYLNKLKHRDDVWYVEGLPRGSTRFAMEKLMDEKVDTIFWFADYEDAIDLAEAEAIAKKLKREGITVIIYDFTGRATNPKRTTVAIDTGGKVISKTLPK